jgi:hypothetical protein
MARLNNVSKIILISCALFSSCSNSSNTSGHKSVSNDSTKEATITNSTNNAFLLQILPPSLPPLAEVLSDATLQKTTWHLSIQYEKKGYKPITHEAYTYALDTFKEYLPVEEYKQAKAIVGEMKDALQWFTVYGDEIAKFLPNSSYRPIPFRFADKDGEKCVILSDLASSSIYNTLRSTSNSRAARVLTSCVIPKIRFLYKAFEQTDFNYFGITFYYGSEDFTRSVNLEAEMFTFIFSRDKCKLFINGKITESEFVEESEVFLTDRDMSFDVKKVKLQIE